MKIIKCQKCGKICESNTIGAGYAVDDAGNHYCYDCSAIMEAQALRDMPVGGKTRLYLIEDTQHNRWSLQNWTGIISIPIYQVKQGRHNIAGVRRDFWFDFWGNAYHGVQYGYGDYSQLAMVTRIKGTR